MTTVLGGYAIPEGRGIYALKVVGLAAVYYGTAKLGLSLTFLNSSISAVWPPTGIALAALIFWGYRMWPGVLLGAFLANSWTGVPFYGAAGIAAGNTCEALAGAYLLRRVADFRPSLERVRDVVALALLAGVLSTMISATVGVASLWISDELSGDGLWTAWRTWWLGDMGGNLVVAPAIMVAITHWPYRRAPGTAIEAVAAGVGLAGAAFIAFFFDAPRAFIVFPFMIWAALRFWQPGAVAAGLIVAGFAIPLTANDHGSFAGLNLDDRLQLAQTFVGVVSISALVLAAVMTERQRIEDGARYISETLQRGLLPAHLPEIPGIEAAVESQPAGEGNLVSGDFYDWFGTGARRWDVMLGDIGGKGPAAARTTALARYTLRADAVHEDRPSRILALLNGALRRQAPGETCTVAYARLILRQREGAELILSLAGHPLPLVVRSSGAVEQLGAAGNLLGAIPEPLLADHRTLLAPGDALLLYTDGLTDAYAPQRVVSVEELVTALTSCAGRPAADIAADVQRVALDGGGDGARDDVTVLVLRVRG
ncbi:MAG TPA: MASE1 domain-containing protein [Solirubrobacterales bacterium]|nr:MASE1 domain-containing protein [Solirubrobacterales bacterium]